VRVVCCKAKHGILKLSTRPHAVIPPVNDGLPGFVRFVDKDGIPRLKAAGKSAFCPAWSGTDSQGRLDGYERR
jgi:hypothetical protein